MQMEVVIKYDIAGESNENNRIASHKLQVPIGLNVRFSAVDTSPMQIFCGATVADVKKLNQQCLLHQ